MKFNKKFGIILTILDVIVIVLVLVIKGNTKVDVKAKDTLAAANVLVDSEDALDDYNSFKDLLSTILISGTYDIYIVAKSGCPVIGQRLVNSGQLNFTK